MACRLCGIMLVLFAACVSWADGPASSHEKLALKMLASLEKIAMSLKGIESEETAKDAKPELRKAAEQWIEARTQAAKLQPPEKDEKERLVKVYKPKIDETLKKMFTEIQRVNVIPGGKDALKEIAGVLKKDGKE